ncbi:hypothetical protein DFH06DRAFT_1335803 [Mycena polygramma]|nr:hypothetical protein DFH06DRAFT_1335803 [Mycena polygramma]
MATHAACLVVHKPPKRSPQICKSAISHTPSSHPAMSNYWSKTSLEITLPQTPPVSPRTKSPMVTGCCRITHCHHGSHSGFNPAFRISSHRHAASMASSNCSAPHAHDILRPYRRKQNRDDLSHAVENNNFAVNVPHTASVASSSHSAHRPRYSATTPSFAPWQCHWWLASKYLAVTNSSCRTPPAASRPRRSVILR